MLGRQCQGSSVSKGSNWELNEPWLGKGLRSLLSFGYVYYEVIRKNESKLVPQEKLSHRGIRHNPRGSTPGFKWQGWSNGGKNQNPKKSLDQNLTPKKSLAEFPSHENLQKALNYITWKTETLVLNTPKYTYLNQATPRKYLPKFSYPKKSRNRKFPTHTKTLRSSRSLEIRNTPGPRSPPPTGARFRINGLHWYKTCQAPFRTRIKWVENVV